MPVAAGKSRRLSRAPRPTGGLWLGLFFLVVFAFVAFAQRPMTGIGWRGLLPAPVAATPTWSRPVGPGAELARDGDGLAVLASSANGGTLTYVRPDGTVKTQVAAGGASFIAEARGRAVVLRSDPPAVGRVQGTSVAWSLLDGEAAPPAVLAVVSSSRADALLVLAGPAGGTGPAGRLQSLTPDGQRLWGTDATEGVVTSIGTGRKGGAAVASFVPGPQPRAWLTAFAADGTVRGRFELGSAPVFRTYLSPDEDALLALDPAGAWLIEPKSGSTRPLTIEAPVAGGFGTGDSVHIATAKGFVLSFTRGGQATWRRQLAGAAVDLLELPAGGLLVCGEDRLYALDTTGRGRWTLAFSEQSRGVLLLPGGDQVVILTGTKILGYSLPGSVKAGP